MNNDLHGAGLASADSRCLSPILLLNRTSQQQNRMSMLLLARCGSYLAGLASPETMRASPRFQKCDMYRVLSNLRGIIQDAVSCLALMVQVITHRISVLIDIRTAACALC